ncbi:Dbl homology domain-containing protein [Radiomyces spectabilis]|uniref:Dbl homology domain-containing protein n=1 Tax=Radiomyces spectabilis TaxID=64574 RepID=UPI00221F61DB|nr:Dbl homology domain-containing protein [Radiomyces spectabilis]KAI8374662.1 Dbl homology domain-containing protein [Radiomyces spectabilis]
MPQFIQDDEQRAYHIQEFIKTEVSYVESLCGLVDLVVRPLRTDSHTKYPILNPFKCTKIFLNIDQILHVNQQFLDELRTNSKQAMPFGDICANYVSGLLVYCIAEERQITIEKEINQ